MQFATINGVTIHYQLIGGRPGAPVIVFSNSLGTDFRIWRDVVVRLAGDYGVVLYDKRGHGLSGIGSTPYRIEDHADDLIALMDHLALKRAVICGLSVGGLIAQQVHEQRPDLVQAIILSDTAHKVGTGDSWNARIAAVEAGGVDSIADQVMNVWFTPAFRDPANPAIHGYRAMLARQPAEGYAATCAALREADLTEAARRIAVPTLCVVGDQDGSTPPALVSSLADLIPGARFEVIADAGHIPCVEQPEALTDLIRGFLAEALPQEARQ